MLQLQIGLQLDFIKGQDQLATGIAKAMRPVLNKAFIDSSPLIEAGLQNMIRRAIKQTNEYQSLINGTLRSELGLVDPDNKMEEILEVWIKSIVVIPVNVKFARASKALEGGLSIKGIKSSMNDVIGLPSATYISENGQRVPWLEWLMLYGDQVILTDHHVKFDLNSYEFKYSRTGLALMQKGGTYRIPAEYSGVAGNNFVTKALENIKDDIEHLIVNEVQRAIR